MKNFRKLFTKNWISFLQIFFLYFISYTCFSQVESLRFKQISVQDGLSQNWVRCIFQDETGYMWFGTAGALNRYDGYELKVYNIGNVNVNAIQKKSDTELWICNDLGVYIYNHKTDSIYPFSMLKGRPVLFVFQDKDKQLWFGSGEGLFKYSPETKRMFNYKHNIEDESSISNNYVKAILEDSAGNIWIGTSNGLNRYEKTTGKFTRFFSSKMQGSLSGDDIMAITEDSKKRIWVGTAQNGINLLIRNGTKEVQFKKVLDGYIMTIMADKQNNLWVARGSNGGLIRIDLNKFLLNEKLVFDCYLNNKLDPKSISDNSIFSLYQDNLQDIWIGTFGAGINYLSHRNKKFYSVKEGISEKPVLKTNLVNAILEEERFLWIGTEVGLVRYDKINETSKHFQYEKNNDKSLSANPVYALYKDSKGNLWVGTWVGGVNLYNYQTGSFKRYLADGKPGSISNGNIFTIKEDLKGDLWIATIGGGVNRYNHNTDKFTHYLQNKKNPKSLKNDIIRDLFVTKKGKVLACSHGYIEEYNAITDDFTHYPVDVKDTGELKNNYAVSIYEDHRGNIWLATNLGLILFNENGQFVYNYTVKHGLPDNGIKAIQEDDNGNLWLVTHKGLTKFVDGTNHPEAAVFINFTTSDGLSSNEFKKRASYKNKSGVMYFGTSEGYTYFHPDSISLNKVPPKVVFTDIQLLDSPTNQNVSFKSKFGNINAINTIELPYNNSDFVIKFASLNYLNPEENKYKYKLEGYDKNWIDAGNTREATYKNLEPRSYRFLVYGSNNDGIWCETPKELKIVVLPPWWKTITFKAFLVLLVILLVIASYRISFSILRRQKRRLEIKVKERTQELSEANAQMEEKQEEITIQNAELDKHRNHLEQLVKERTQELEIAKARAEESDRLKTAFLHNISHEIRTPLNAIIGFSLFFEDSDLSDEKRIEYARIIVQSSNQLLSIITDIINISSLEAGKEVVHESQFNLNDVLKVLHIDYEPSAQKRKILFNLDFGLDDGNSKIISDKIKLTEIIANLVQNAIKFTKHGHVKYGYVLKDNFLEFYVEDTGIGINEEEFELIFERFRQSDYDKDKAFGGTGLGLAISKSYVELLGGKIWLASKLGIGTTFYFTIPYKNATT